MAHILGIDFFNGDLLAPIMQKRRCKPPVRFSTAFATAGADLAEGVLDTDDTMAIRKTIEAIQEAQKVRSRPTRSCADASAGGAPVAAATPVRRSGRRRAPQRSIAWPSGLPVARLILRSWGTTCLASSAARSERTRPFTYVSWRPTRPRRRRRPGPKFGTAAPQTGRPPCIA